MVFSLEPDDLELSPFSLRGGSGKAYRLFDEPRHKLPDEFNEVPAA